MKIILCFGVMLFISLRLCAQGDIVVKGKVSRVKDGAIIQIWKAGGNVLSVVGIDTLERGKFYFRFPVDHDKPERFLISFRKQKGFPNTDCEIWCVPGKPVVVTGTNKLLKTWKVKSGVKEQHDLNEYTETTHALLDIIQLLRIESFEREEELRVKGISKVRQEQLRIEIDSLRKRKDSVELLVIEKQLRIMDKNPIGIIWLEKLKGIAISYKFSVGKFPYKEKLYSLYNRLIDAEKQSEAGKTITTCLFPLEVVKVGENMVDADLYDWEGRIHHLADYKGKFILLDFWSCGCAACFSAFPEIQEVGKIFKDQLVVVSLNIDDLKNWKKTPEAENVIWKNLNDLQGQNGLYARYGAKGTPHYVLISPEGKVLDLWGGYVKGKVTCIMKKNIEKTQVYR